MTALGGRRETAAGAPEPSRARRRANVGRLFQVATLAADAAAVLGTLLYLGVADGSAAPIALGALAAAWLLVLRGCGAYRRGLGYTLASEARSIALGAFAGVLPLLQLGPLVGLESTRPRLASVLLPVCLLALGRAALRLAGNVLRRRRALTRRVLLVGHGPDAYELLENIGAWPGLGMSVVGICADSDDSAFSGFPVLGPTDSVLEVSRELGVRTVMLAPGVLAAEESSRLHSALLDAGLEVIVTPNVAHISSGRISTWQLGGVPVLLLRHQDDWLRSLVKNVVDKLTAATLLTLLAPLLVPLAIAVKLDSPGPVFFRQTRVGRKGAQFTLWKFRTMVVDAEARRAELVAARANNGDPRLFKLERDPRVTRVGAFLRRTSLDELPQLWNVLVGHMSLVGPRPALPDEVSEFDEFTLRRLRVRPGITGLWQVSGRADASFATYSRMDAYYAENWSLVGDLKILLRTIPAVLGSKGAY